MFSYKTDNNGDVVFDAYKDGNENPLIPMFGAKKDFQTSNQKTTELENPLFYPLLIARAAGYDVYGSHFGLPTILPEKYKIDEELPSYNDKATTYKGKPTCGIIIRDEVFAYYDPTETHEYMPLLTQFRPRTSVDNPGVYTFPCYADTNAIDHDSGDDLLMPGLVSTFYRQYLHIADNAAEILTKSNIKLHQFAAETFSTLKVVQLQEQTILAMLLQISNMNPVTMELPEIQLLKWVETTLEDEETITHNDSILYPAPLLNP